MPLEMNCMNCGRALGIKQWGQNCICPYCGKCTATVDIKEVHVNFSNTTYGEPATLPRESSNRFIAGVDYLRVRFSMELSLGDISSPPHSNAFAYAHRYSGAQSMTRAIKYHISKLAQASNDAIVYLWVNETDINSYLNLLKFANLFKRFEEVYLIRCCTESDMQNDEYEPNDSFANKTRLSNAELDAMTAEYSRIVSLGGKYRIGRYGDVHICSEEYLQGFVMNEITNKYRDFPFIDYKVREAFEASTGYIIPYHTVVELVWRLMTQGKVKSRGACMWWGDSHHNNMLCTQSFRKADRQRKSLTFDEVPAVVCDAFEFGYTYPLYELLDDRSTLTQGKLSIVGKRGVIEHIENYGSYRINSCEERVSCRITRVEEGDVYILLNYEKDESQKYWLVKVVLDGIVIRALELSELQDGLKQTTAE